MTDHPGVAGRPVELRALADAVRRLVHLTVTSVAPADETAAAARELAAIGDRLAGHVPSPPLPRFVVDEPVERTSMADQMPFDALVGAYNPLAVPIEIEIDPPRAIGRVMFSTAYEGPPGCVHGGVIAAAFDMVLSAANRVADAAGPTARLHLAYRRPTLLERPVVFEAEVVERTGRRTRTTGRLVQDGNITVEAEGHFAVLDRADIFRLHRRGEQEK